MTIRNRFRGTTPVPQWLRSGSPIISRIQRGTITLNNVTSNTATITAVDPSRARLVFLGTSVAGLGATAAPRDCKVRIALTNATTVTATVNTATAIDHIVGFEVIEYLPNVVKSIQRGTGSTVAATSFTATISAVDTTKATVDHLGYETSYTVLQDNTSDIRLTLTNATTLTWTSPSGTAITAAGYQVVEFL